MLVEAGCCTFGSQLGRLQYVLPDYFLNEPPCNKNFVNRLKAAIEKTSNSGSVLILEREGDEGYRAWTVERHVDAEGWIQQSKRSVIPFA